MGQEDDYPDEMEERLINDEYKVCALLQAGL